MSRRTRKTNSLLKIVIYIFFSSILFLLILNLVFPNNSWFRKATVINPIVQNSNDTERSKISRLLLDSSIPFSSMKFIKSYFDIELIDMSRVYISSKKDIGVQISSLQAILKQLTINGKRFKLIDFRFDKPVIVYE